MEFVAGGVAVALGGDGGGGDGGSDLVEGMMGGRAGSTPVQGAAGPPGPTGLPGPDNSPLLPVAPLPPTFSPLRNTGFTAKNTLLRFVAVYPVAASSGRESSSTRKQRS